MSKKCYFPYNLIFKGHNSNWHSYLIIRKEFEENVFWVSFWRRTTTKKINSYKLFAVQRKQLTRETYTSWKCHKGPRTPRFEDIAPDQAVFFVDKILPGVWSMNGVVVVVVVVVWTIKTVKSTSSFHNFNSGFHFSYLKI